MNILFLNRCSTLCGCAKLKIYRNSQYNQRRATAFASWSNGKMDCLGDDTPSPRSAGAVPHSLFFSFHCAKGPTCNLFGWSGLLEITPIYMCRTTAAYNRLCGSLSKQKDRTTALTFLRDLYLPVYPLTR